MVPAVPLSMTSAYAARAIGQGLQIQNAAVIDGGRCEGLAARVLDADRRSGDRLDHDVDQLGRGIHDELVDRVESGERRTHHETGGSLQSTRCERGHSDQ